MRTGKIYVNDLSGGQVTSSPLLSTPPKYSRYLRNYYINAAGNIKKIPGYSPISNHLSNVRITTGIDFKKSDGTSEKLVGGRNGSYGALYKLSAGALSLLKGDFASQDPLYMSQIGDYVMASNGADKPIVYDDEGTIANVQMPFNAGSVYFTGVGLDDIAVDIPTDVADNAYKFSISQKGTTSVTPDFTGAGANDLSVPDPNFSGSGVSTTNYTLISDFSDGTYSGWTVASGTWSAAEFYLHCTTGSIHYPSTGVVGSWKLDMKLSVLDNTSKATFIFLEESAAGKGYGIRMWHPTDHTTRYELIAIDEFGSVTVLDYYTKISTDSGGTEIDADTDFHTVIVSRDSSSNFSLYVDSVNAISYHDDSYDTAGLIVCQAATDAGYAAFDNIYYSSSIGSSAKFDVEVESVTTPVDTNSLVDDFSGTLSKWTVTQGWSIVNGSAYSSTAGIMHTNDTFGPIGSWGFRYKIQNGGFFSIGFMSKYSILIVQEIQSGNQYTDYALIVASGPSGSGVSIGSFRVSSIDTDWHYVVVTRNASGGFSVTVDSTIGAITANNTYSSVASYIIASFFYGGSSNIDDINFYDSTIVPNGDTIGYSVNGGAVATGSLTESFLGVDIGNVFLRASSIIGHLNTDYYEIKITTKGSSVSKVADKFKWRKNGADWSAEIDCTDGYSYYSLDSDYAISFKSKYTNTLNDLFRFQVNGAAVIDSVSCADKFKWRENGSDYVVDKFVTSKESPTLLADGISVGFGRYTGHTVGNSWSFDVQRDLFAFYIDSVLDSSDNILTTDYSSLSNGVKVKFGSINGHSLGDYWTIAAGQEVLFGKSYPYKNRLWVVGSDGLTSYYSALSYPKDFTGDTAGYIDFRYVLPEADELMDICSLMNYLVFFFKNHIVIYAGTDPTSTGDFIIYQMIPDMGIPAANTIVNVGSDIYFLTDRGIKSLNQTLTAGALNVGNMSEAIDIDVINAIAANTSGVYASAHYATLGLVMFLVGTTMFVYNYRQKAWSTIVIPSENDVSKILSMFQTADGRVYMGGYDYLFEFDPDTTTWNFNGQAPVYRWTSGMFKTTSADSIYFSEMLMRLLSPNAVTFNMKVRAIGYDTQYEDQSDFNEQTVEVPAITPSDVVMNFARAPLCGAGKFIQFDLTETPSYDANGDTEISAIEVSGEMGQI